MLLQKRYLLCVFWFLGGLPWWTQGLPVQLRRTVRWVASNLLAISCTAVVTTQSLVCHAQQDFAFSNGQSVQLNDPLSIRLTNYGNAKSKLLLLTHPVLVGWGGGGSVFAFDDEPNLLVKISWADSTTSVRRECSTLQYLETQHVASAERCLGEVPYPNDPRRVMIVGKMDVFGIRAFHFHF
jgi:hypothetical protein